MSKEVQHSEPVEEKKSFLKVIVHSFFIIPFLIAVFCVLLFAAVNLLTRENRTAFDYLNDVKTGGATKRWQGAFELSKILANQDLVPNDERFRRELINAFEQARHDDPRVRQYLALAMGRTEQAEYVQPLIDGLKAEHEESIPALLYALGMIGDSKALKPVSLYMDHPSARVRSITVVALGSLMNREAIPYLKRGLGDSEPNVQWGSAIALAHLGDSSGKEILSQLLNREYFTSFKEVDPEEQTNLILQAISAAAMLDDRDLNEQIKNLAEFDKNMKVKASAMELSQKFSS